MSVKLARVRRPVTFAAALLATSALCAISVEIKANQDARAALAQILASHEGLSVDSVAAEPFSGTLSLRGIRMRSGTTSVSIGALHLPLPYSGFGLIGTAAASPFDDKEPAPTEAAPPAPAPPPPPAVAPAATMGSTSADNVVIVSGTTTYRIKRIDMTGTTLTNADLAALLDVKSPESAETRLKKFTAAAVVIPELLADKVLPDGEQHMSMTHILLAQVAAGRVAAASAGEISFSVKDKAVTNGTTGAIEAVDLDLTQIAHVFGSVRTNEKEPILPLYEVVIVNAIKVTNVTQKATFSVGKLKEVGAKGRALKTDIATASSAAAKADPSDAKSAALFDDMAHSFEIRLLEMTDVSSRSEGPDGTTTFAFSGASMKNFADRKIGGLDLSGFHLEGPEMKFGLGTMTVGAFVIPPSKGSAAADASATTMAPPGVVDLKQIDVDVVSKTEKTEDTPASKTNVKFKIDHVGFTGNGQPNEIPPKATLAVDNVSFDVPPGDAAGFNAMGYSHVTMSGALATTYDANAQDLVVDNLSVNGTDMGALTTTLHLINVGKGLASSDKDVQASSLVAILIKALDIKLKNAGLFEKAIAYKAGKDGETVAQERDKGVDFFLNQLPASVNNNPKVKTIGAAIAKFITDPKTLHIAISSKNGLGVAAMGLLSSPELILDTLDVQASAND